MSFRRVPGLTALVLLAAWLAMYRLGRTWGSTRDERRRVLPGDDLVANPLMGGDHAITIGASPDEVWPWLVQVGWHRGGWYTYRWVDSLLFPQNRASAERILPEYQELQKGARILDGPPQLGCYFVVENLEAGRHMVLHSTTHLPPQLMNRPGVAMSWTWAFVIEPVGVSSTRFQFRWRATIRPFWLRVVYQALVMPADFVMGRSMCLGLKRRAEEAARLRHDATKSSPSVSAGTP